MLVSRKGRCKMRWIMLLVCGVAGAVWGVGVLNTQPCGMKVKNDVFQYVCHCGRCVDGVSPDVPE
jgi:hypothetical protein